MLKITIFHKRERVFCISILNKNNFIFPSPEECCINFYDFLDENSIDENVILTSNDLKKMKEFGAKYNFGGYIIKGNIYNTITANYGKTSGNSGKFLYKNNKYRILTPKECWRLMGFADKDFEKAEKVCSRTQLYKQAGNSIVVNCLAAILKQLFK